MDLRQPVAEPDFVAGLPGQIRSVNNRLAIGFQHFCIDLQHPLNGFLLLAARRRVTCEQKPQKKESGEKPLSIYCESKKLFQITVSENTYFTIVISSMRFLAPAYLSMTQRK